MYGPHCHFHCVASTAAGQDDCRCARKESDRTSLYVIHEALQVGGLLSSAWVLQGEAGNVGEKLLALQPPGPDVSSAGSIESSTRLRGAFEVDGPQLLIAMPVALALAMTHLAAEDCPS